MKPRAHNYKTLISDRIVAFMSKAVRVLMYLHQSKIAHIAKTIRGIRLFTGVRPRARALLIMSHNSGIL